MHFVCLYCTCLLEIMFFLLLHLDNTTAWRTEGRTEIRHQIVNHYVVSDLLELICHVSRSNAQVWLVTDSCSCSNPERAFVDDHSCQYSWHQKRLWSCTDDHAVQRAAGSRFTLSCTRKKKEEEKFISSRQIQDIHTKCSYHVLIVNVNYYVVTDLLELVCHVSRSNAQVWRVTDWRSNPEPSFVDDHSHQYTWHQKRPWSRTDGHAG